MTKLISNNNIINNNSNVMTWKMSKGRKTPTHNNNLQDHGATPEFSTIHQWNVLIYINYENGLFADVIILKTYLTLCVDISSHVLIMGCWEGRGEAY